MPFLYPVEMAQKHLIAMIPANKSQGVKRGNHVNPSCLIHKEGEEIRKHS